MGLGDTVGGFVVLALVFALAMALRYRSAARRRELEQVRLLERERLARDLHDTIAHHVSAMAIRAQAGLATAATNPTAAVDALRLIDAEASRALSEMRTMVRYLRDDQPGAESVRSPVTPNPGIAELANLTAHRHGGPSVDVEIVGEIDSVPQSVASAIYRLAQESVTNAHRHARHATRIAVRVVADDRAVHLRVSDDGEAVAGSAGTSGVRPRRHGRTGRLLGGVCEAGPNPDRGWTVAAVCAGRSDAVTIRVVVADDQEMIRTGLTMILNAQPGIEVRRIGRRRARSRRTGSAPAARRLPVRHPHAAPGRHRGHPVARRPGRR
jgi:signal transduction histidine kinase